jgi:signal transduction histidine kinase
MDESADTVRSSIRALRSLVVDIYPPDFDQVTLESALTDLAGRVGEGGIEASVDVSGLADPVPDPVARLLYRAAQEGVRNVLAHAGASTVRVTASTLGTMAVIDVIDDGQGLSDEALGGRAGPGHVGLRALQGLVNDAGGAVHITSEAGRGTTLRVEVPLP